MPRREGSQLASAGDAATAWHKATATATASHPTSKLSVAFSPISPAPFRVGEGEPPPSWDMVPTTKAMFAKTFASGSPKLRRFLAPSGSKKKDSPKCSRAKKSGASPRVAKKRAEWTPALEKSLVDILHQYKESGYRGDNGWNSEGWNKMVKEFHLRNKYVNFTKSQIQDKETQLKRDYKMLKEARRQSGASWNEERNMVEGSPAMWDNLELTFPKIKKFRNNKAKFPLFDALGELHDGHLAEGTYNFTSLESLQDEEPLRQIHDLEDEVQDLDDIEVHEVTDEDDTTTERQASEVVAIERSGQGGTLSHDDGSEVAAVERSGKRRTITTSSNKPEKEEKRPRRGAKLEDMMGRYLEMRTKQVEEEAVVASDFSIKRCISVLNTMQLTTQEKAKAIAVFIKSIENREAFLSGCEADVESTLIWLRSEMV